MKISDILQSAKEKAIETYKDLRSNPKKLVFYSLIVILICLFSFTFKLINLEPFIHSFELYLFDFRTRLNVQIHGKEPDKDIVLLLHNDLSNNIINDNPEIGLSKWPFPRRVMGELLIYLKRADSKTISFDVIFSGSSNEEDDNAFRDQLKEANNDFLGFIMLRDLNAFIKSIPSFDNLKSIDTYNEVIVGYKKSIINKSPQPTELLDLFKNKFINIPKEEYQKLNLNTLISMTYMLPSGIFQKFLESTHNIGILNMEREDNITEVSREYKTLYKYQDTDLFAQSLPLAIARDTFLNPKNITITFDHNPILDTSYLKMGKKSFALNKKGNIYINWRGIKSNKDDNFLEFKKFGDNKINTIPLAKAFVYERFETMDPHKGIKRDTDFKILTEKSIFNKIISGEKISDIYSRYLITNHRCLTSSEYGVLYGGYTDRLYALVNNLSPNSLATLAFDNYNKRNEYYNYSNDYFTIYNLPLRTFNKIAGIPLNIELYRDNYKKEYNKNKKQKNKLDINPIIKEFNSNYSFIDINRNILKELDRYNNLYLNPYQLKNKIIIIGEATATGDIHSTPVAKAYPGPEIVGTTLDNILNDGTDNSKFIIEAPLWLNILVFIIFISITSLAMLKASNYQNSIILFFAIFLLFILFNIIMFINPFVRIWINMIYPMVFIILTGLSTIAYKNMIIDKDKKQIRELFGKFVSPQILEAVINDPKILSSNVPRKKEMSVLFSDIRDFTTKSELSKPEELIQQLNEYLSEMVEVIIMKHNGTLDKYMGDAVMAFWGDPIPMEDHALRAVLTGIAMREHLKLLNNRWLKEGKPELKIGIGVNTGEMIVGHMGSPRLIDYTVLGDNVNVASRLEGLNKQYGTDFIISESTYEYVKDYIEAEYLGPIKVKGRAQEVKVYSVIKIKDDVDVSYNTEAKLFT